MNLISNVAADKSDHYQTLLNNQTSIKEAIQTLKNSYNTELTTLAQDLLNVKNQLDSYNSHLYLANCNS
ncbi:hypothetical protein [Mucilaginibacter phyllosphaerae]